jgi:DNA ligase 1
MNSWQEFLSKNKGKGKTIQQLSAEYKKSKAKKPAAKKPAAKKPAAKKPTAKKPAAKKPAAKKPAAKKGSKSIQQIINETTDKLVTGLKGLTVTGSAKAAPKKAASKKLTTKKGSKSLQQIINDTTDKLVTGLKGLTGPAKKKAPAKKGSIKQTITETTDTVVTGLKGLIPDTQSLKIFQKTVNVEDWCNEYKCVKFNQSTFKPMLAKNMTELIDPSGWWASEKLDGVRSIFANGKFMSRNGKPFFAPQWFIDQMPKGVVLDGELYTKRGDFDNIMSIVSKKKPVDDEWKNIVYMVFDLPTIKEPFETRYPLLKNLVKSVNSRYLKLVVNQKMTNQKQVDGLLDSYVSKGAEGLMLRAPGSYYENKRSGNLLKLKKFEDQEAVVVGYEFGKGKYSDLMGALRVKWYSGKHKGVEFNVGSGFTDEHRTKYKKLFPKNSIVKVKYFSINEKSGKPRFPIYVGKRSLIDL